MADKKISELTELATTPANDDKIPLVDTDADETKFVQISNLFGVSHSHTESDISDLDHTDSAAVHDNVAGEINAVTEKASPVSADLVLIEDSEDSNNKKRAQLGNLPGGAGGGDLLSDLVNSEVSISTTTALTSGAFGKLHKISTEQLVLSGTYQWTASGSGTNEYYLEANGGGDPGISEPSNVCEDNARMVVGTMGSLTASQWDWGDNDSLGYNTVYVRLSDDTDPDTKADGYLDTDYVITLPDPSGNGESFIGFYGSATLVRFMKLAPNGSELIRGLSFDCIHASKFMILYCDGTNWQALSISNDMTINATLHIDNGMSDAIINSWSDCVPHNLGGNTLIVQYADGTYSVAVSHDYAGFRNGTLRVYGNTGDNSLSTTKSVFLDTDGNNCTGISISSCTAITYANYFKIEIDSGSANSGIIFNTCAKVQGWYNYILGDGVGNGYGIRINGCAGGKVLNNYVSNVENGISSENGSDVLSDTNDDTGTAPAYGLYASAGTIRKNSTQPAGSTSNELTDNGGDIL